MHYELLIFYLRIAAFLSFFWGINQGICQKHYLILHKIDTTISAAAFARLTDTISRHSDSITASKDLKLRVSKLHGAGYLAASTDSMVRDSLNTHAYIRIGNRYQWAFLSKGNVDEGWLSKTGFRERLYKNRVFNFREVTLLQDKIVEQAENNGYPFASVSLDSLLVINGALAASLNIKLNTLYIIDSLVVKGKSNTKRSYLEHYLGIRPGGLYDESRIARISSRLRELPFLTEMQTASVRFYEKKANVVLFLDQKKASQFDGLLGVLPDNARPGKVLLTGELNLRLLSAIGYGELIELRWRKLQALTQDLKVNLAYPYLLGTPFGLEYKLDLYKRDSTFLNLVNHAGVQYLLVGGNFIKAFVENRSSRLISTRGLENVLTLPANADARLLLYGLGARFDKVDYRLNPKKGIKTSFQVGFGNKQIILNPRLRPEVYDSLRLKTVQVNAELNLEYYISLAARHVLKTRFQGARMFNSQLFQNELFRIGGLRTLRGFDEESLFVSSYGIGTLEYRFLLETNSFFYAFMDGGWWERNLPRRYQRDNPFGVGVGLSFETRLGIFTINYALGSENGRLAPFRAAKVHFGVVGQF